MFPFHLSIPVVDLESSKHFYTNILGCKTSRSSLRWVDFDFFGHQLTTHLTEMPLDDYRSNQVDGHNIPVRHFGLVLSHEIWHQVKDTLIKFDSTFVVKPHLRYEGRPEEHHSMFFMDPSNNILEFKSYKNSEMIFTNYFVEN